MTSEMFPIFCPIQNPHQLPPLSPLRPGTIEAAAIKQTTWLSPAENLHNRINQLLSENLCLKNERDQLQRDVTRLNDDGQGAKPSKLPRRLVPSCKKATTARKTPTPSDNQPSASNEDITKNDSRSSLDDDDNGERGDSPSEDLDECWSEMSLNAQILALVEENASKGERNQDPLLKEIEDSEKKAEAPGVARAAGSEAEAESEPAEDETKSESSSDAEEQDVTSSEANPILRMFSEAVDELKEQANDSSTNTVGVWQGTAADNNPEMMDTANLKYIVDLRDLYLRLQAYTEDFTGILHEVDRSNKAKSATIHFDTPFNLEKEPLIVKPKPIHASRLPIPEKPSTSSQGSDVEPTQPTKNTVPAKGGRDRGPGTVGLTFTRYELERLRDNLDVAMSQSLQLLIAFRSNGGSATLKLADIGQQAREIARQASTLTTSQKDMIDSEVQTSHSSDTMSSSDLDEESGGLSSSMEEVVAVAQQVAPPERPSLAEILEGALYEVCVDEIKMHAKAALVFYSVQMLADWTYDMVLSGQDTL